MSPLTRLYSTASFFLSRIDVLIDQLLGHRIRTSRPSEHAEHAPHLERLLGQVAIANAKLAYQSFKRRFGTAQWQGLAAQGARVQRPLWASTGTKNPLYRDTYYVASLIGPHTVTTMPSETIAAFADHGRVSPNTVEANLQETHGILQGLERLDIDFHCVTWQLQNEGIQKFLDPYDALMQALAAKSQELLRERASR